MEIIANIGFNWWTKGDISKRAKELVSTAIDTGVDGICIPYFRAEKVHRVPNALKQFKKFNTPEELIYDLRDMANESNVSFYVAPSDHEAVGFLKKIGITNYHVESGSATYLPLLEELINERVLLSTGFTTFSEIEKATNVLLEFENDDYSINDLGNVILMHSTGAKPTPAKEAQLNRIIELQAEFYPVYVGLESFFHDRLLDFVSMTYRPAVIMRRLDLDDKKGTETNYSLSPSELRTLVNMASSMDAVNNPEFYAEEFVEGDWDARINYLRCAESGYTLPPES